MSHFIYEWEKPLYRLAFQKINRIEKGEKSSELSQQVITNAYQHAKRITYENSKTFFMASAFLPSAKCQAIRTLYAFCRISDDLVDLKHKDPRVFLQNWYQPSLTENTAHQDLIAYAWAETRKKFAIPWQYSEQLIDGVAQDMTKVRYQTFDELTQYCYGVASTVGLMSMHIIGFKSDDAYPYAIRLGVALQLTNILRDVGEDFQNGRIYLPKDELKAFHLSHEDLSRGVVTPAWREFMRFQIGRNRRLYAEAKPGIALLNKDGQFAIQAAADLYEMILGEIEKNDYDVFTQRASVSKKDKLYRLPKIWQRSFKQHQRGLIG